jgi:CheY-like chemotaxis protein
MTTDNLSSRDIFNVLFVEDDPDHAEMVLENLEHRKEINKVIHIADGESALDYLFNRGEYSDAEKFPRPQLVLLDLRLPKTDGIEVLQEVERSGKFKDIPIVVLTSSEEEKDIAKAYEYGANSYLVKPITIDGFSRIMKELGFYWLIDGFPPDASDKRNNGS